MGYQIGIDVGGTFTDLVAVDDHNTFRPVKVPSTPHDEAVGVLQGIAALAEAYGTSTGALLGEADVTILGTTVVTNTMLEYSGVDTGLITTRGFRDVIDLRRSYKESLFDVRLPAPHPIVRRHKRLGVTERIDYAGTIVLPLNEEETRQAVRTLKSLGVKAIAVCFLFSFVNSAHERRVREIIQEEYPEAFVSLSCEVLPQVREFERLSTTVVNAYVSPKLSAYLRNLDGRLREGGFRGDLFVMLSHGGMMDVEYTSQRGVEAILSGPCGGVVGAQFVGGLSGYKDVISVDMGGTSYDICLVKDAQPKIGVDTWISRYRLANPLVDIHTIGAGGGSIAWVDDGGALRVGPRSAGADPGPASYGRGGTEPTVTDADLLLGYINPEYFLGGRMTLSRAAAESAIETRIAKPLGLGLVDAAHGIFRIVNATMTNGIRYTTVSRGHDPRDFALIAFGGAGPIHAGMQAMDLGIRTVLVPKNAPVFSSLGNLVSNIKISKVRSFIRRSTEIDVNDVNAAFQGMYAEAESLLGRKGKLRETILQRAVDVRYMGQTREVTVPLRSRTRRVTDVTIAATIHDFHDMHEQLYSFKRPDQPVETLNLRLDLIGVRDALKLPSMPLEDESPERARKGTRRVYFDARGFVETPLFDGATVRPGNLIAGPAIIEEPDTSIVIYPGQEALLDQYMTYVIEVHQ